MSKLVCECGHIIIDQTDTITYKGYIIPDVFIDELFDTITDSIEGLTSIKNSEDRIAWIKKHFSVPPYPTDLEFDSMMYDITSSAFDKRSQTMYECEQCGRLAIQINKTNKYKFYVPETDITTKVLKTKKIE